MYQYNDIQAMQKTAEQIDDVLRPGTGYGDFYRTGIEIYVGSFPDVSGPDLVIDPYDHKGVELFKEFAAKLADHYKTIQTHDTRTKEAGRDKSHGGADKIDSDKNL